MKGLENNAAELFRLMDRVRKAWQSVTPCEHLSKSQFGTLMAIAHHGRMPGQSCTPSQEHGALTLTALAGAMHQSLPALSQRVSALEAMWSACPTRMTGVSSASASPRRGAL